MPGTTCCCRCIGYIFSAGLSALLIWLSIRPSRPTLSIEDFSVAALNTTSKSNLTTTNTTLFFHLKLRNNNKDEGVHYDALHLSFYRIHNLTSHVANASIPRFYQGHKKTAHRKESIQTVRVEWERERKEVSNGTTVFRVSLETAVRYKIVLWNTKRHTISVGGNLTLDGGGALVKRHKKGVKLSGASLLQVGECPHVSWLIGMFTTLVLLLV